MTIERKNDNKNDYSDDDSDYGDEDDDNDDGNSDDDCDDDCNDDNDDGYSDDDCDDDCNDDNDDDSDDDDNVNNNSNDTTYHIKVGKWNDRLQLLAHFTVNDPLQNEINTGRHVLFEQSVEFLSFLVAASSVTPLLPERVVAEVLGIHVHHTAARNRCRGGIPEISDLKYIHLIRRSVV